MENLTSQFTGKQYLMLDVASLFGLDKKPWEERLQWFEQHENELENLVDAADEPNCFLAAVNAWRDVQQKKPIGYAINLDATASGCQVLSLLTCDTKSAARVNLVNTGNREDLYTYIYNKMKEKAPHLAKDITRDKVKKSIMTSLYGSEAKPKETFGEENYKLFEQVMNEELPAVWKLNKFLLKNWNPRKTMYSWVMPDNFHVDCIVENRVKYETRVLGQDITFTKKVEGCAEKGRFLSANLAHSVDGLINREITIRSSFTKEYKDYLRKLTDLNAIFDNSEENDYIQPKNSKYMFKTLWKRYEASGFLSARILQYVNRDNLKLVGVEGIKAIHELVESLPEHTFEVYAIHDCFRVLPTYGNDLRQLYRYICAQIARSSMLNDIVSSMFGVKVNFKKIDPKLPELVMKSEYAVC